MQKNILHTNYNISRKSYQLKLPLELDCMIPDNDFVRLLSAFVEEMDLTALYGTYTKLKNNQLSPACLLKILLYANSNRIYSSRDIETACKRDINFMYLLEGGRPPHHATIARFRSLHFAPVAHELMAELSNKLYELGEISGDAIFIDGTKIESSANKYTFVWKNAVTKNMAKLFIKIETLIAECNELFGLKLCFDKVVEVKDLKKLKKKLQQLKTQSSITFVHGIGKRKTILQKKMEELDDYLNRLKDYKRKVYNCGERNSYSKTDPDATFMRMKEDAMKNGQLKPAYNLQHGVDSEYIVWLSICHNPTDVLTLVPFMKSMENKFSFKYNKVVADAGYESEQNYTFLEENNQLSFIKPSNYEQSKKRKYKNNIGLAENMPYDVLDDYYTCHYARKISFIKTVRRMNQKTGEVSSRSVYECKDCSGCPFKEKCITSWSKVPIEDRNKRMEIAYKFQIQRKRNLERIISREGIKLRVNRSIQVEGSFAQIKEDMGFRRFLSKGKVNVLGESIALAMSFNLKKLHNKIQKGRTGTHLHEVNIA